jgi:hypothetical protein
MMMMVERYRKKKERKEYYTTDRHTYAYVMGNTVIYYAKEKQGE